MLRASVIAALTFGVCHAFAQTPAPPPEFEVASINRNKSENRSSSLTGRIVLDKTGLTGKYNFDLRYKPEQSQFQARPGITASGIATVPNADLDRPYLFIAIQEQLGLKLESQKGPIEMMVIDHVERPSEN
ncbi:MAG: TIGR03435 family protein [Bryobacteraceae bacterium]